MKYKGERVAVTLRMPVFLRNRFMAIAKANGDTLNDWMIQQLEQSSADDDATAPDSACDPARNRGDRQA